MFPSPRFNYRTSTLVTAPSVEPVSVADVKLFARIDGTDEDSLLSSLIGTARRAAETYTRRAFITQTWMLTQDGFSDLFGDCALSGVMIAPNPALVDGSSAIDLPREPIQSIASVKTFDTANVETTVDSAVYRLDAASSRLLLNAGQTWPSSLRPEGAVQIRFVAGYGDAATDVPAEIRQAIMMHVTAMYENRMCADLPSCAMALLDPFRTAEAYGAW